MTRPDIELYEDNAGGLSLLARYDNGWPPVRYTGLEHLPPGSTFRGEAAAFAAGDTDSWTLERYEGDDAIDDWTGDHIATYYPAEDRVIVWQQPGSAGRDYLGADYDATADEPYPGHLTELAEARRGDAAEEAARDAWHRANDSRLFA